MNTSPVPLLDQPAVQTQDAPQTNWKTAILRWSGWFAADPAAALISDEARAARQRQLWQWSTFVSITLGYAFFYTARLSQSVVRVSMLEAGVASAVQLGTMGMVFKLAYAIGKTVNGFLADHVNVRKLFATGLLVSAFMNLGFGMTTVYGAFLVFSLINGWFQSVGVPCSGIMITRWFSPRQKGTRYSIWSTAHSIGEGVSMVLTAAIAAHFGWRWGFFAPGLVCLAVAVMLFFSVGDSPRAKGLTTPENTGQDKGAPPASKPKSWSQVLRLQAEILTNPWLWVVALASGCMYVSRYAINDWAIVYLKVDKGYSLSGAGALVSIFPFASIAGAALAGTISDVFFKSRRALVTNVYGLILVASLLGIYFMPAGNFWIEVICYVAGGFSLGGMLVFLGGLIALDLTSSHAAGAALGFIGGVSYLFASLGDQLSGYLIHTSKIKFGTLTVQYSDFSDAKILWVGGAVVAFVLSLSLFWVEKRGHEAARVARNLPPLKTHS